MKKTLLLFALCLSCQAADHVLKFEWEPSLDTNVIGYKLMISTNQPPTGTNYIAETTLFSGTTNALWSNCVVGVSYWAWATATNAAGLESYPSVVLLFSVPDAPSLLKVKRGL